EQDPKHQSEEDAGHDDEEVEHRRKRLPIEQQRERRQENSKDVDHRSPPSSPACHLGINCFNAMSGAIAGPISVTLLHQPQDSKRLPMLSNRIVPLIVAVALFMENMDSTVIATSLP